MKTPMGIAEDIWKNYWPTRRPETVMDIAQVVTMALDEFRAEAKKVMNHLIRSTRLTHEEMITHRHLEARRVFAAELMAFLPFSDGASVPCESAQPGFEELMRRIAKSTSPQAESAALILLEEKESQVIERVRTWIHSFHMGSAIAGLMNQSAILEDLKREFDRTFPPAKKSEEVDWIGAASREISLQVADAINSKQSGFIDITGIITKHFTKDSV